MSNAIVAIDLRMRFGRREVLRGVDLTVGRGSVYALIGSNGTGKTTTIKILMNLLFGAEGRAEVLGVASQDLGPREYARIGYVSENQEIPAELTAGQMLEFWRPFYDSWDTNRERELVSLFRLPLDRKLKHCSRGMRMKVLLASALSHRPELIVMDEPFSGLDPLVRDEMAEALLEQAADSTILISSHDLAEIENFASHVGYLEDGKIQFSEEMSALEGRFREVEVTVDTPALPAALPQTWLRTEMAAAVVRFVETQWDPERTRRDVEAVFPTAREIAARPMPLRSIFVTLAKAGRKAA